MSIDFLNQLQKIILLISLLDFWGRKMNIKLPELPGVFVLFIVLFVALVLLLLYNLVNPGKEIV